MRNPTQADDQAPPTLPKGGPSIMDRIAAFAMLDGMKDATQAQKSIRLSIVGFPNSEIAAMLQTSPAVIASNLYTERRRAGKKASPRKAGPTEESLA